MKPLYNDDFFLDILSIVSHIDEFGASIGISDVLVNVPMVKGIVLGMRKDFPHEPGVEAASLFKKTANFMCYFMATKPISSPMPGDLGKLSACETNAVFAVDIGLHALRGGIIHKKSGDQAIDSVRLSVHSYFDLVDLLSRGVVPQSHIHWLSLYLEQLVFKANPSIEYEDFAYL